MNERKRSLSRLLSLLMTRGYLLVVFSLMACPLAWGQGSQQSASPQTVLAQGQKSARYRCAQRVPGRMSPYWDISQPVYFENEYFELKPDGTFFFQDYGEHITGFGGIESYYGKYEIDGHVITLQFGFFGLARRGTIEGDTIKVSMEDCDTYTKSAVRGSVSSAQSTEDIPVPEYYGIYAVVHGKLLDLEGRASTMTPDTVGIRFLEGEPGNFATSGKQLTPKVPLLPSSVRFLVYIQPSGLASPMSVAMKFKLRHLTYIRKARVMGDPALKDSRTMNAWYAGDVVMWRRLAESSDFLTKPVPGRPDMALAVPPGPLSPGVYSLNTGDGSFLFAVAPLTKGETKKCFDVSYILAEDHVTWRFVANPCSNAASVEGGPPPTAATQPRGVQPSTAEPICADYDSCLKASVTAFQAQRWDESLSYLEEASRLAPERGEAYVMMAGAYFERGDYNKFYEMADKGLSLGSVATAKICRDRFGVCEQGTLLLSRQEVALTNTRQQKVFSAPPSQVTSRPATLYTQASAAYSQLTVAGKNYRLYLIPEAVQCQIDLVPICPEPGFTQQKVFANYVHHAIQRLASGTLTKPEPPPAPATFAVVPGGTIGQFRHGTLVISGSWEVAQTPQQATHTHAGVDIAADIGTPVYALADGTVVDMIVSDRDVNFDSLGYMVIIKHTQPIEGKATYSAYFHLHEPPAVAFNQAVLGGRTQIGVVGKWGAATGPHLHLEVRHFRSRFFEHPEWNNIYGVGDQRSKPAFLENWSDPEKLGVKLY